MFHGLPNCGGTTHFISQSTLVQVFDQLGLFIESSSLDQEETKKGIRELEQVLKLFKDK